MARQVRSNLGSRSWRLKQPARKDPYWQQIEHGLSVGYHRPAKGGAGTWWGRVRLEGAYRIEALATADDHQDADGETVLSWSQAQAAVRTWAAKQTGAGPRTVADAVAAYVADLRARRGDAAANEAEGRLRKHLLPFLGNRRVADLDEADIRAFRNRMVKTGDEETVRRSRDSANRVLRIAKAALGRTGPWRAVEAFADVGEARKIILTGSEQQRLIDACEPGLREFALLVAWTGARPGRELTKARVRDFDPGARTLTVTSNKGYRGKLRQRDIYLDDQALALLRRLASGKRPNDYLLTTADGEPWAKSLHTRRVQAAVEQAKLDAATTLYALRHSYISGALKAGIPVKAVADQCGTSIAMIQRFYAKFIPTDLARYAKKAAPKLRTTEATAKVVALRRGAA
jgi:site-specific recombinase XerD